MEFTKEKLRIGENTQGKNHIAEPMRENEGQERETETCPSDLKLLKEITEPDQTASMFGAIAPNNTATTSSPHGSPELVSASAVKNLCPIR